PPQSTHHVRHLGRLVTPWIRDCRRAAGVRPARGAIDRAVRLVERCARRPIEEVGQERGIAVATAGNGLITPDRAAQGVIAVNLLIYYCAESMHALVIAESIEPIPIAAFGPDVHVVSSVVVPEHREA